MRVAAFGFPGMAFYGNLDGKSCQSEPSDSLSSHIASVRKRSSRHLVDLAWVLGCHASVSVQLESAAGQVRQEGMLLQLRVQRDGMAWATAQQHHASNVGPLGLVRVLEAGLAVPDTGLHRTSQSDSTTYLS